MSTIPVNRRYLTGLRSVARRRVDDGFRILSRMALQPTDTEREDPRRALARLGLVAESAIDEESGAREEPDARPRRSRTM